MKNRVLFLCFVGYLIGEEKVFFSRVINQPAVRSISKTFRYDDFGVIEFHPDFLFQGCPGV
jgi:hypothetical protein